MKTTTHYSRAEVSLENRPDTVLISINGTNPAYEDNQPPELREWKAVYTFHFDDVLPDGRSPRYKGVSPRIPEVFEPMCVVDADYMRHIIRKHWDDSIHAHCAAGVSRSAAVAAVLVALGWEYILPEMRAFGIQYANQHVVSLLKAQFPEQFGLIGQ